jgi:hypothetical protein
MANFKTTTLSVSVEQKEYLKSLPRGVASEKLRECLNQMMKEDGKEVSDIACDERNELNKFLSRSDVKNELSPYTKKLDNLYKFLIISNVLLIFIVLFILSLVIF